MKTIVKLAVLELVLTTINFHPSTILAQGTAFTYQGRLNSEGNPASGSYDLTFALYNVASGGSPVGGLLTNGPTAVSNGLFTVTLDFGNQFTGADRWLEIGTRASGGGEFTVLSPRQQLTATPYAIQAANAATAASANSVAAANISGTMALAQLPSSVVTNGASGVSISGTFSGNGAGVTNVPGTMPWQPVAATTVTATANRAYLLTNNALSSITLPTVASAGDVVIVSAVGSNGCQVWAAPGQTIAGYTDWSTNNNAPVTNWQSLASSADGTKLVAGIGVPGQAGQIYTSTDSGTNWTARGSLRLWYSVASSSDGSRLVAGGLGYIYTSTNSGVTWQANSNAPSATWNSVASSADGLKIVAVARSGGAGGHIYTSTDSGLTWSANNDAPFNDWSAVASSEDGTKLVAAGYGGKIYTSADSGVTWSINDTVPSASWRSMASSADGTKLVAAGQYGVFTSSDSGATWTAHTPSYYVVAVASSADGTKLMAVVGGSSPGPIYSSADSGATWTAVSRVPVANWACVASSADGTKIAAGILGGQIWTVGQCVRAAGTTAEFQYLGNGLWQPVSHFNSQVPASQISGGISLSQLPSVMVTNGANGVSLSGSFGGNGGGLTNLNASNLASGTVPSGRLAGSYTNALTLNNAGNSFTGNGSGLTNFNASQLATGTVPDGRLSANVALRSGGNTFTGNQLVTAGNVGIGVASPARLLQLGGAVNTEAIMRMFSQDSFGVAARGFDVGVAKSDATTAGKFYSFSIQDTGASLPAFLVRWDTGNIGLYNTNPIAMLTVGNAVSPAYCNGTTWVNGSDRNAKENFQPIDPAQVLERVVSLPVQSWSYKGQPKDKHIGPMAQDFHAAFGLNGKDDTHIATVDESGVALAAIQGLNRKVEQRETEITELKQNVAELKALVKQLLAHEKGDTK